MMDPYNMPLFQGLDPSMNFPYKETSTRQYILVKQFSVKKKTFLFAKLQDHLRLYSCYFVC